MITDQFFVHAEHESLRYQGLLQDLSTFRTTVNSDFAGLGYRQQMGSRAAFDVVLLYNFSLDNNYFVYNQPEFRFNFLIDLF